MFEEFSFVFRFDYLKNIVFSSLPVFLELVLAIEKKEYRGETWFEYEMFIIAESTLTI